MSRPAAMVLVSVAAVAGAAIGFVTATLIAAELLAEHASDAEALDSASARPVEGLGTMRFQRRA